MTLTLKAKRINFCPMDFKSLAKINFKAGEKGAKVLFYAASLLLLLTASIFKLRLKSLLLFTLKYEKIKHNLCACSSIILTVILKS